MWLLHFLAIFIFIFLLVSWGGVRGIHLVRGPLIGILYQSRITDDDEYGVVSGMRIGRGAQSTRRKPAQVSLYPPQIQHDLTWDRARAVAVGNRRLTA
jgi:hypothetical protein